MFQLDSSQEGMKMKKETTTIEPGKAASNSYKIESLAVLVV
jgi:hypothetical protein